MAQKLLASRAGTGAAAPTAAEPGEWVEVRIDQLVLTRRATALASPPVAQSLEVAAWYDQRPFSEAGARTDAVLKACDAGLVVGRAGAGFAASVHLERFAGPARLALTDDVRLAALGAVGMLALPATDAQLLSALSSGVARLQQPASVQLTLTGRLRPFVCAKDVALELARRGIGEQLRALAERLGTAVVLELTGPATRLLSVAERAVLCGAAPELGAASALFISDEKTEVFLRDQRRSKAHRALCIDAGAPCVESLSVDLAAVDPLVRDEHGVVRTVRELAGRPMQRAVLGGDVGVTLRDLMAAAALLKSKRVPAELELLLAPPSRQVLEVLAESGALADLIATGARLVEPDERLLSGELYPPLGDGGSTVRTFETPVGAPRTLVASAETLAYAVAYGELGDPRQFKRPVRVTVPRELPTEDVLLVRPVRSGSRTSVPPVSQPSEAPAAVAEDSSTKLPIAKAAQRTKRAKAS